MSEARSDERARLDRKRVRAAFDRASAGYDQAAALQARVRTELAERLTLFKLTPVVALDLGTGTGGGAQALVRAYWRAIVLALDNSEGMLREARRRSGVFRRFTRVLADAVALPLAAGSVDLVFSSLMLQWCDDLAQVLVEVRRVLKPGGLFIFSTFGPDTLHELRAAWAAADEDSHVNRFLDVHDVGDALTRAGFGEPVLDVERVMLKYADATELMRALKAIGARNATRGRSRALTGRAHLQKMRAAYEALRADGRLPATFEVIYACAWGEEERPQALARGGEVEIPIGAIRRRP
jgi:malonyl-CoA O-methyltransferase